MTDNGFMSKQRPKQPSIPQIICIYNTTVSELDSLARKVNPCEIDVESGLNYAENDGHCVRCAVIRVEFTPDPIQDVESAI
jgi:hypothetical protein